jgi:mannan endo-1,4-beta-mannosidase
MKKNAFNKLSFLKATFSVLATAMLAQQAFALSPLGPLRIHDGKLLDSYGKPFIFRGVTIDHTRAPEKTLQALRDIAAAGANSAQIELPLYPNAEMFPRPIVAQVREIIAECKANKLICVLEPNDVAGYPFYTTIGSDLLTFWTWPDMLSVLYGNQAHIIIGLGNQHFGDDTFREYEYRMPAYAESLVNALPGGYVVMIDGNDWSEDTSKHMFNFAKRLKDQASVLSRRLIYSVDMFYSYQDPTRVHDYIASFNEIGAPLVIGGFAPVPYYHPHRPIPLNQDAPQLPAESVMQYAEQYGAGYFGWSWSGNKNSGLDLVTNYDASALTNWGKLLFDDANGIRATAKLASIYGTTSSSSSSSSAANQSPAAKIEIHDPRQACTGAYAGLVTVTLKATGSSDPDGDTLTYSWKISGDVRGPTLGEGPSIAFLAESGTSYEVTLTATDPQGASDTSIGVILPDAICPRSSSSSFSTSSEYSSASSSSSHPSSSFSSKFSSSSRLSHSSTSSRSSSSQTSSNSSMPFIQGVCSYHIQSEWRDGFTATIRLKNVSSLPMNGWDVKWQYPDTSKVTNLWNANLSGTNPYSAKNLGWNATIQPGQTVEFGFQGKKPEGPALTPAFTGTVCLPTFIQ